MVIRAKTKTLFKGKALTEKQAKNSELNMKELEEGAAILKSLPRRIVFELTNECNLRCIMCGRNSAYFKPSYLDMKSFYALSELFDTVEEVTLMGWGEPTLHPEFEEMLKIIGKSPARIYFCTNGMKLDALIETIFESGTDIISVSIDAASQKLNGDIRRGSDLDAINAALRKTVKTKREKQTKYPHLNYVFCAMRKNLHELPAVVDMAAKIGLDEVKVVFFTAFDEKLAAETLYGLTNRVEEIFSEAEKRAAETGILLKLPYICGQDPAAEKLHRDCYVTYRDFFIGSDGFVRPCMSASEKLFKFDVNRDFRDMWNSAEFQRIRKTVNTENMPPQCRNCHQSSHCNFNKKSSYIRYGLPFAPEWD